MTQVFFYYDVVCPYSYLETHAVEAAVDAGALEVTWLPFELRPAPRPLLEPRGDHLRVDWTRNVYRRAQGLGIEIHLPRYQPRSTLPLAACLWATEQGALRSFKAALYEAFFCEGEDISSEAQIARGCSRRRPRSGRCHRRSAQRGLDRQACRGARGGRGRGRRGRSIARRGRAAALGHRRRRAVAARRGARSPRDLIERGMRGPGRRTPRIHGSDGRIDVARVMPGYAELESRVLAERSAVSGVRPHEVHDALPGVVRGVLVLRLPAVEEAVGRALVGDDVV